MKTEREIFIERIESFFENGNITKAQIFDAFNKYEDAIEDEDEDEPYFGWCDVEGCENEGCSGGMAWDNTGKYWTVCHKHSQQHREGKPQPKMKQSAIERENRRDKETGFLKLANE